MFFIKSGSLIGCVMLMTLFNGLVPSAQAETFKLQLRSIGNDQTAARRLVRQTKNEEWEASQTAVVVCDVWDLHHCLNAVRRLEEFAPRLDQVLKEARRRGAVIIHAPSDCMPAYADHPARLRALKAPRASTLPSGIEHWCSRLPTEGSYPIDQSDGGEDDDPQEHAEWAAKLKSMGRNPGTPWKRQSDLITIDAERDYISDRGDEVWNVLEQRGIKNVILTGVHCNMCVLGRPFGLRQMARHQKHVVLMRDLTDSMYSPKRWPYVDHFTGHQRVLDHVETHVCPTITSDQILGGSPFRWKADPTKQDDVFTTPRLATNSDPIDLMKHWTTSSGTIQFQKAVEKAEGPFLQRGALLVDGDWLKKSAVKLVRYRSGSEQVQVWLNGHPVPGMKDENQDKYDAFTLPTEHLNVNDYNLIVIKLTNSTEQTRLRTNDVKLSIGNQTHQLRGHWQVRSGDDPQFANIPLPAKFGIGPDAVLTISAVP